MSMRWVFDVNFLVLGIRFRFLRLLISQGTPHHFTVTGSENSICIPAHCGTYNASKHAVLGLTETLNLETPDFFGVSICVRRWWRPISRHR